MTIESIAIVLNHSQATGTDKLVLLGIANHYGDNGAWPSIATLARYANVDPRNVSRSISKLIDLGELVSNQNGAPTAHYNKPNHYEILVSCPENCDRSFNHRIDRGDTSIITRGDTSIRGVVIPVSSEPLSNRNLEPDISPNKFEEDFETFWNLYPRKVEKVDAKKAFKQALANAAVNEITDGAKRLALDPNKPEKQFIPYPATWLRAGGWTNEPYPERTLSKDEAREVASVISIDRAEREKAHTAAMLDEQNRILAEARQNPPKRCEHDRVAVMCQQCQLKPLT